MGVNFKVLPFVERVTSTRYLYTIYLLIHLLTYLLDYSEFVQHKDHGEKDSENESEFKTMGIKNMTRLLK